MSISYDPDGVPKLSPELLEFAVSQRMHIANIVCSENKDDSTEESSVSFIAILAFLPREGEIITLDDGKDCIVQSVIYKITAFGQFRIMIPNVIAFYDS